MAFKVNLPQTEVILPVTGKSVRVQPLVLRHQIAIAESEVHTLSERYRFLCELLWDRIINKDDFNNSLEVFLSSIYDSDLPAIAYGVVSLTYKKTYPFLRICPDCGYMNSFEIPVRDLVSEMNVNVGGQDQFYSEIHTYIDEELSVTYNVRVPTMSDVLKVLKYAESKGIDLLQESVKADNLDALALKVAPITILPSLYSIKDAEGNEIKVDLSSKAILDQVYEILTNDIPDLSGVVEFITNLNTKYYVKFGFKAVCTNPECLSYKENKPNFYEVDILTDFFPIKVKGAGVQ